MDIWTGHLDGTCPGQCPGHVQDIKIFLGHCPVPALLTPKPAVSRCLGIVFTKALTPSFKRRPPEAIKTPHPPIKYRPWMVQYDTRIIPHHILTNKQLARHKRLGIYNPDSWSKFPKDRIKITVN